MSVSKSKTRTILTIEITDKEKLVEIAKFQNRSMNNLIATILKEYIKNHYEEATKKP